MNYLIALLMLMLNIQLMITKIIRVVFKTTYRFITTL